ncbi:hypothetical protein Tco_0363793 [Tanacetum coccineum]
MRDGLRDNNASQIYMNDDTPTCEPHEANYIQGYHGGYHDRKPINSYSYLNQNLKRNYPSFWPQNRMPHPSEYFELPKTSIEEMMREWMASQMKANERMKDQGDVKAIEEDEIKPIPTNSKPNPIMSNSPIVPPFREDCVLHISYTNVKMFADDVLPNHVGDKELKLIDGVGNGGGCLEVKSIDLTSLC